MENPGAVGRHNNNGPEVREVEGEMEFRQEVG